jgi:alpha-aminoadipic semialdehyde synthase
MHGLGHRFLGMGYSTAFLVSSGTRRLPDKRSSKYQNVAMAHNYRTLDQARESLRQLGEVISDEGTPKDFGPLTFTFTGNGNVSKVSSLRRTVEPFALCLIFL